MIANSCPAQAVDGGTGAYFLGSRDTFAGIVQLPGTHETNNFAFVSGKGPMLSLGGVPVTSPEVNVYINYTHELKAKRRFQSSIVWGSINFSV